MAPKGKTEKGESLYVNRELSWLRFNERVLLEAGDAGVPLLERLKFLMIYQSNLEEFYRVRIGILMHRALLQPDKGDPLTGMTPDQQISEVVRVTKEQQVLLESIWKAVRAEVFLNPLRAWSAYSWTIVYPSRFAKARMSASCCSMETSRWPAEE